MEAVQGEMLHRDGDEPLVASELNEAATTAALPRELRQDASAAACDEPCARCGSIGDYCSAFATPFHAPLLQRS
ncbi:hypothetical protein, partial [Eggerthella lenta]|uniref:hypothetical protein n=1 Tax=Eggerthella lenta TaxID=84112 RepID=UPI001C38BE7D